MRTKALLLPFFVSSVLFATSCGKGGSFNYLASQEDRAEAPTEPAQKEKRDTRKPISHGRVTLDEYIQKHIANGVQVPDELLSHYKRLKLLSERIDRVKAGDILNSPPQPDQNGYVSAQEVAVYKVMRYATKTKTIDDVLLEAAFESTLGQEGIMRLREVTEMKDGYWIELYPEEKEIGIRQSNRGGAEALPDRMFIYKFQLLATAEQLAQGVELNFKAQLKDLGVYRHHFKTRILSRFKEVPYRRIQKVLKAQAAANAKH